MTSSNPSHIIDQWDSDKFRQIIIASWIDASCDTSTQCREKRAEGRQWESFKQFWISEFSFVIFIWLKKLRGFLNVPSVCASSAKAWWMAWKGSVEMFCETGFWASLPFDGVWATSVSTPDQWLLFCKTSSPHATWARAKFRSVRGHYDCSQQGAQCFVCVQNHWCYLSLSWLEPSFSLRVQDDWSPLIRSP